MTQNIEIIEYNAAWPAQFLAERAILQTALAPWLVGDIEHIGSTSVVGLAAKAVIDIMAPVASLEASRGAIAATESVGYCFYPYKPDEMHWFLQALARGADTSFAPRAARQPDLGGAAGFQTRAATKPSIGAGIRRFETPFSATFRQ